MAFDGRHNKLRRKEAVGMQDLMIQYLRDMKLTSGMNRQRVAEAWNTVSGASRYTLSVSFERGVMTCVISSSLVRNQLYFQRDVLVQKMNEFLKSDNLYDSGGKDGPAVRTLILK
ncbi:MAG: DUF721 domain-containing protein [Bacteroidales bacterium]|nr:DUF721 domain-containing protein [Bacteroidales bacterium]